MTIRAIPAYERVKNHIRLQISQGKLAPGDLVPSENALLAQFGISRMTANRAIRELMHEGLLYRVPGLGTFVQELSPVSSNLMLHDIHAEIEQRGHRHRCKVLLAKEEKVKKATQEMFGHDVTDKVFHTIMLHLENEVPIQYEDRYVNPQVAPDYLTTNFAETTPTKYLMRHAPLTAASFTLSAVLPDAEVAKCLNMVAHEPCLMMERCTQSSGLVASWVRLYYPGSRYRFQGDFSV